MPPLENPRWETFAQELAAGKPATEAFVLAGYKFNDGNCIRLKGNERVSARVKELVERKAANDAARAQVTVESLLNELEEARKHAVEINRHRRRSVQ